MGSEHPRSRNIALGATGRLQLLMSEAVKNLIAFVRHDQKKLRHAGSRSVRMGRKQSERAGNGHGFRSVPRYTL
jgi:hypothetical protein